MRHRHPLPSVLLFAGALSGLAGTSAAQEPSPAPAASPTSPPSERRVDTIEITGVTRYDKETIWEVLGLRPGARLRRDPAELAQLVEDNYRIGGYAAARARVDYDAAARTLRVAVDEGVLAAVDVAGVDAGERESVLALLALKPGQPFNDEEVADALRRLDSATSGAYQAHGDPPYTVERGDAGVRVTLQLRRRAFRVTFRPGTTGRAPLYNRVDGLALGVRAEALAYALTPLSPLELYAHPTYAFAANKMRYAVGLRQPIAGGRAFVGYERHDFTDTDDTFRGAGVERLGGTHIFFNTFEDFFRRRGHEVWAVLRPTPRFQLGVNFRSDTFESQPLESDGNLFLDPEPPPNPPVAEGLGRALLFSARWAWRDALFSTVREEREAFLLRDPYGTPFRRAQALRAEATFEMAEPDALGGVLDYSRFIGHVRGATRVAARPALRQWLLAEVMVGMGSDGLPPQRRFALGGMGTLRGRARNEVAGDRMALATAEWAFELSSPLPALILFYDGGTAWDRDGERPPWRHDAGMGLAWPPGDTPLLRVDFAIPLNDIVERRLRVSGFVRLPI